MKKILDDPRGWAVYSAKARVLMEKKGLEVDFKAIMQAYIHGKSVEEYLNALSTAATKVWRQWVKDNYGSWRLWALQRVTDNIRVRKRLPRLTAEATRRGLIHEG